MGAMEIHYNSEFLMLPQLFLSSRGLVRSPENTHPQYTPVEVLSLGERTWCQPHLLVSAKDSLTVCRAPCLIMSYC